MPHHRPRFSLLLPAVTSLAVTVALAAHLRHEDHPIRSADDGEQVSVATSLSEVALSGAPAVVLPLPELRGLTLPDLHLSDLRKLPLPTGIPIPHGLPEPPGPQLPESVPPPQLPVPDAAAPLSNSIIPGTDAAPGDSIDAIPRDGTDAVPGSGPGSAPRDDADPDANPGAAPLDNAGPTPGDGTSRDDTVSGSATPNDTAVDGAPLPGPDYSAPALAPGAIPSDLAPRLGAQVREITRDTPFRQADPQTQPDAPPDPPAQQPSSPNPHRSPLQRSANPTDQMLTLVGSDPIATYWAASGAAAGPLGDATALPRAATDGAQFATFTNGYVYSGPGDAVTELTGPLLDRYLALGADSGPLGLPTRSPHPAPDGGIRADFRYGALILDANADTVSTVLDAVPDTPAAPTTPAPTDPDDTAAAADSSAATPEPMADNESQ